MAQPSGTRRTGLMSFTLRNQGVWSVKKKKLSERSEFFFFSSVSPDFSKIRAALIFCFFLIKQKENAFANKAIRKEIFNNIMQLFPYLQNQTDVHFHTYIKKDQI